MKNFKNSKIINESRINKSRKNTLPIEHQSAINKKLYEKVMRFLNEIQSEPARIGELSEIDTMFEQMHGKRIKDLMHMRKQNKRVVSLFCHAVPPELFYAQADTVSVSICCGGAELERYADSELPDACSLSRSLLGFLNTGMCVFHNVANHAVNVKACHSFCSLKHAKALKTDKFKAENLSNNSTAQFARELDGYIKQNALNGLKTENLLETAKLYHEIRSVYNKISEVRKSDNPPLSGKDMLWMYQMYLTVEPLYLLDTLQIIFKGLQEADVNGKGYNPHGLKKRVLLLTARHMPPYTQLFRITENAGGIVVKEMMCTGVHNVNYRLDKLRELCRNKTFADREIIEYMVASPAVNDLACSSEIDEAQLLQTIRDYNAEAVICFAFDNCPTGIEKTERVGAILKNKLPVYIVNTDYEDTYEREDEITEGIKRFLFGI